MSCAEQLIAATFLHRTLCTCRCSCALARWPCECPRPDNKSGRSESYFLHLSTDNWIKPNGQRGEKRAREKKKNIRRRTSGISQSKHIVRKSTLTWNETFQTSASCPPLAIRWRPRSHDHFHFSLLTCSPGWERKTKQEQTLFFKATADYRLIAPTDAFMLKDLVYQHLKRCCCLFFFCLQFLICCNPQVTWLPFVSIDCFHFAENPWYRIIL